MATEIRMPRLGWTMEEGIFGEWLKHDGDKIQAGDFLFTIEGDKATQEIEAFDSGILRIPPNAAKPGDLITVGTVLAYTVRLGESFDFENKSTTTATTLAVAPQEATAAVAASAEQSKIQNLKLVLEGSKIAISPRARRVANELGVDWSGLTGSGSTGRIVERDIRAAAALAATKAVEQPAAEPEEKVRATPIAVRMAQEAGIDLAELAAQKPGVRIDRADVEAAIAAQTITSSAPPATTPPAAETIPVTNIRRLIAQRMLESAQGTASVTLTTEIDATALVKLREELKAAFAPRGYAVPSYNDLFAKLTAVALQEHPLLNARWQGDEIVLNKAVHMGIAVDTPEGLLVPVVRNVHSQNLREIAAQSKALIEKALARKLSAAELQDGTFTITNLGIYNIDAFTPIINPPQCAILGIGRIVKKPAVVGEKIKARDMVALSLTFDHRIVDGAPAARFLDLVRQLIQTPVLWLAG
jgi:pyruvate dehydrogenase E2 component (dihydrolipoamide acetyltransferase)